MSNTVRITVRWWLAPVSDDDFTTCSLVNYDLVAYHRRLRSWHFKRVRPQKYRVTCIINYQG